MELSGKGGMYLCENQNTGGCQCAPACPSGYSSVLCECIYGNNVANLAEAGHSHSWLYVFSAIGLFAIVLAAGYLVKKYLISNEVKIPLQSQAEINSRYINIVEAKWKWFSSNISYSNTYSFQMNDFHIFIKYLIYWPSSSKSALELRKFHNMKNKENHLFFVRKYKNSWETWIITVNQLSLQNFVVFHF